MFGKSRYLVLISMLAGSMMGIQACSDDNSGTVDDVPATCDPACVEGCTCDDGVCKDAEGNVCLDKPLDPEPEVCDPACKDGCTCKDGACVDGDGNACVDKPAEPEPEVCDPACKEGCTCKDGACIDGDGNACVNEPVDPEPEVCDPACKEGCTCKDGACVDGDGNACVDEPVDPEPEVCDPACKEGCTCKDGACIDGDGNACVDEPEVCDPVCAEGCTCKDGACIDGDGNACVAPEKPVDACDPACTDGAVCLGGKCVCPDNMTCAGLKCEPGCEAPAVCNEAIGRCECPEGEVCGLLECDPACAEPAVCVNGLCQCPEGATCEPEPVCDEACVAPAACVKGACVCPDGLNCDGTPGARVCDPACEGLYECVNGKCECPEGKDCSAIEPPVAVCDPACTGKYTCVEGECVCPDGEVCEVEEDDSWLYETEDCAYADSDGDLIADILEGRATKRDTDGDGIPDYLDEDSDNDGVPDKIEGETRGCSGDEPRDRDGDGIPNYLDTDSDNNGIPDGVEIGDINAPTDTDGDKLPDYLDRDNDGDTILDTYEILGSITPGGSEESLTFAGDCNNDGQPDARGSIEAPIDCDSDTIPDYLDPDSDNDTIPDKVEASIYYKNWYVRYMTDADANGIPDSIEGDADPDEDKLPNYLDEDNDNDGLKDVLENEIGSNPNLTDTDGDKYLDASEYAAAKYAVENKLVIKGTPITSIAQVINNKDIGVKDIFDFYFELPYEGERKDDILEFIPKVSKLDLVFNVDTTGSMYSAISNVKTNINSIITTIRSMVSDSGFALVNFDDFPTGGYGDASSSDLPFRVLGKVSTDEATVTKYTQNSLFKTRYGADGPESGVESLHHIVTGKGTSWNYYNSYNPAGSLPDATNAKDRWGGVDFRNGTLPVIIHVTDVESHDADTYPYNKTYVPAPHYSDDLLAAVQKTGARIIQLGTGTGGTKRTQGEKWAKGSNAVVPVCAFGLSATTCNLGTYKPAPTTIDGKANQCVLNYEGAQTSVATMISAGVDALVKYGTYDVSTRIEGVPIPGSTKDTSCFIKQVEAKAYVAPPADPEKTCNPKATPTKVGGATYNNGFTNFAPGTSSVSKEGARLHFTVYAQNDNCVEPIEEAQTFTAYIDVINPTTGLVFGRRQVSIIVPGEFNFEMGN